MSKETDQWLNTNILVGFTAQRGNAWHYKASAQGEESNHYEGAIPVEDVQRRLFNFEVQEQPIFIKLPDGTFKTVENRKALVTNDTFDTFGVFKGGYQGHQYSEWLVDNISTILNHDTGLGIANAGLLANRARAFVQVEVPENIKTPEGVEFRPNILAATSFDGSLATTYKRTVTNIVCDNTLECGLSETGQVFRVKHSRNSSLQIANARDALAIVEQTADDFSAEVARLANIEVTLNEWALLLDELVPVPSDEGSSRTRAESKRSDLEGLYKNDHRVAPWAGTAFGVLQAFNTWGQHYKTVKGISRGERNFSNAILGLSADDDVNTLSALTNVRSRRVLTHA